MFTKYNLTNSWLDKIIYCILTAECQLKEQKLGDKSVLFVESLISYDNLIEKLKQ